MDLSSKFFLIFLLFISFTVTDTFAQQRFQEGYYIKSEGNKVDTQIENKNWVTWSNEYLLVSESGVQRKIPLSELQEFGIAKK